MIASVSSCCSCRSRLDQFPLLTDRQTYFLLSQEVSAGGFAADGVQLPRLVVEVTESVLFPIRVGSWGRGGGGVRGASCSGVALT